MSILRAVVGMVGLTLSVAPASPAAFAQQPTTVDIRNDVRFGTAGGTALLLDVYSPSTAGSARPAVLLVHGGEWVSGDKAVMRVEGIRLAELGWVALSVNYRLEGPSHWPEELQDVQQALRWTVANAADLGIDPSRIGALGSSSGGHLAAMLGTIGSGAVPAAGTSPQPGPLTLGAVVTYSGIFDLNNVRGPETGRDPALPRQPVEAFLGCAKSDCPGRYTEASPITYVGPRSAPMLIINSESEVVPADQARRMADGLDRNGVANQLTILAGDTHGMTAPCDTRPCPRGYVDQVWGATLDFLGAHLGPPPPPPAPPAEPADPTTGSSTVGGGPGGTVAPGDPDATAGSDTTAPDGAAAPAPGDEVPGAPGATVTGGSREEAAAGSSRVEDDEERVLPVAIPAVVLVLATSAAFLRLRHTRLKSARP